MKSQRYIVRKYNGIEKLIFAKNEKQAIEKARGIAHAGSLPVVLQRVTVKKLAKSITIFPLIG